MIALYIILYLLGIVCGCISSWKYAREFSYFEWLSWILVVILIFVMILNRIEDKLNRE